MSRLAATLNQGKLTTRDYKRLEAVGQFMSGLIG
jgi:hypothetical protein